MEFDTPPLSLDEQIKNLITGVENAKTINDLRERLGCKAREIYDSLDLLGAYHRDGWWYVPATKAEAESNFMIEGQIARNNVRQKAELRLTRKAATQMAAELEKRDEAEYYRNRDVSPLPVDRKDFRPGTTELVALASDWHFGANFRSSMTNEQNEFNLEIAERRIRQYFSRLCDQLEKFRTVRNISNFHFCLMGDLIDGVLHQSSQLAGIGNLHSAREQAERCQDLIAGGLIEIEKIFPYTQVLTTHGNHGRATEKRVTNQGYEYSHEQYMYEGLAKEFGRRGSKMHFCTKAQKFYTFPVLDKVLLITHGDTIRVNGGFNGLDKYSQNNYRTHGHDHMICGHFHYAVSTPFLTVNGSLMGLSPYAYEAGYVSTEISQTTLIVEAGKGIQNEKIYIDP